jgi:hypothetical protein
MFLSGLDSCIDFQVFMPNHNHFNGPGTAHSQSSPQPTTGSVLFKFAI